MKEIQMNGATYQVTWPFVGQERPYGDFFRVAEIITTDENPDSILELMRTFYNYDVSLKKDWNYNSMGEYFAGYCEVTPIKGGFKYVKCEPYTD